MSEQPQSDYPGVDYENGGRDVMAEAAQENEENKAASKGSIWAEPEPIDDRVIRGAALNAAMSLGLTDVTDLILSARHVESYLRVGTVPDQPGPGRG